MKPRGPRPRALDRKLIRDLWRLRGQVFAIALVVAAGVAVHLVATGMLSSLKATREAYYRETLFADVWAPTVRAPQRLIEDVRMIDGVAAADTRVRAPALFEMPALAAPAAGELLSLPDVGDAAVNRVRLVRGRLPRAGAADEAVVLAAFADAHRLEIGDLVEVTVRGRRHRYVLVGVVLSPEHVYAIGPGQFVPDDRYFGVLWLRRSGLAQSVDQDQAFNEVVARLSRGASERAVIAALDRLLGPYGAPGAYGRADQVSDAFVSSEIDQLSTMGRVLPPVFLLVAAFLVNVVIARAVATERAGIGLLKAFGHRDHAVIAHYLKFTGAVGVLGIAMGGLAGHVFGQAMAGMYTRYYRFPVLVFEADARDYLLVFGIALTAVLAGGALAARRITAMGPAEAMTPPRPADYSRAVGGWITDLPIMDQPSRMIVRQIVRWPGRAALTVAGVTASAGLLVGTLSMMDGMRVMVDASFAVANPYDLSVTFTDPRPRAALFSLAREPGVLRAEPFRAVPVRLRHEWREKRTAIVGAPLDARLSRLVDVRNRAVAPPPGGIVLSSDLADALGARPGDIVEVEVTEGRRPRLALPLAAVAVTYVGSGARMQIEALNRALGEGPQISGAWLIVDPKRAGDLHARLKRAPTVAGLGLQDEAVRRLAELMDQNIGVAIWTYAGFAGVIAAGVVYNTLRISFAERQRELASLRVLGFTRSEVAYILLGEAALLTLLALPLGLAAGAGLARYLSTAMSSELFRLPFAITSATCGIAVLVVLAVTTAAGLIVRARLDGLDLVSALKTGE